MRGFLVAFALLAASVMAGGCTSKPATAMPVVRYPPTWTPSATPPPTAIPPTATLVIQRTPVLAATPDPHFKRLPMVPPNGIGHWIETQDLTPDVVADLAADTQVVTGPLALQLREKNRGAFAFLRLDGQNVISAAAASSLDTVYAGVIVENLGFGAEDASDAATTQLGQARAWLGPRLLIAETYAWRDGAAFFEHQGDTASLLEKVDGVCLCRFMREAETPLTQFKKESAWRQDVDALAALSSNRALVVLASVPFGKPAQGSEGSPQEWINYVFGSFLLGVNNTHTFFNVQGERASRLVTAPILATGIGTPISRYVSIAGIYERRFTQGIVLVNPTSDTRTRSLSRRYKNANDAIVARITLPPHSGMILLNAD